MSKLKPIEKELHKLLQTKDVDLMLYSSVRSVLNIHPNATINEACLNFHDTFNITDDDWSIESMKVSYHRIHKETIKTKLWNHED